MPQHASRFFNLQIFQRDTWDVVSSTGVLDVTVCERLAIQGKFMQKNIKRKKREHAIACLDFCQRDMRDALSVGFATYLQLQGSQTQCLRLATEPRHKMSKMSCQLLLLDDLSLHLERW